MDDDDDEELKDALVHRTTLSRNALLLDSALDAHLANRITRMREEGTFLGLGFASDESPPSQVRFKGLRFQVALAYRRRSQSSLLGRGGSTMGGHHSTGNHLSWI